MKTVPLCRGDMLKLNNVEESKVSRLTFTVGGVYHQLHHNKMMDIFVWMMIRSFSNISKSVMIQFLLISQVWDQYDAMIVLDGYMITNSIWHMTRIQMNVFIFLWCIISHLINITMWIDILLYPYLVSGGADDVGAEGRVCFGGLHVDEWRWTR